MNDLDRRRRITGQILLDGADIYDRRTDVVELRQRVGMVFQKSNPFPKSIYENVAYGLRIAGVSEQARCSTRPSRRSLRARRAVGRGEGPARTTARSACPAASSSGCASRARSPSSPRSCSWTSRARRSIRSRRRRSRS